MKLLYIECNMGAAGDMLMSALSELLPDPNLFIEKMNGLKLPGVHFARSTETKCGLKGSHIHVTVNGIEEIQQHHHSHTQMTDIVHILEELPVSLAVKRDAQTIYQLIAEAESAAHGCPVEQIHFHEVGSMDAVADIVGVCQLIEELNPDHIAVSPIHVGSGQVICAHGVLPVPAPATAFLLQGIPTYGGNISGELCTPTGAALLKYFGDQFGPMPMMATEKIGYGMGTKDFEAANCVRAFWGETISGKSSDPNDSIVQLSCNLDDMTGEAISFACERLWEEGALDVWLLPIQMKKNRPGQTLNCLCRPEDSNQMAALILKHTTTWGVRKTICERYCMKVAKTSVDTPYGTLFLKQGNGYGIEKKKPEYEDVAQIAKEEELSFCEVLHHTSI